MPLTETTSTKTTYFDPVLVVDETDGLVSVGLRRNYLIETETTGKTTERETGNQWLVYESKKFNWKNENSNSDPQYVITLPEDLWETIQVFMLKIKHA